MGTGMENVQEVRTHKHLLSYEADETVAFLFVALLLKVNVDNEGSAGFFNIVVGCMSILPIALPLGIKAYMVLYGNSEARAITRDNAWELS